MRSALLVLILNLLALVPSCGQARAQGGMDANPRDRFIAAMTAMEQLKQHKDAAAFVAQADMLQGGLPISETNPLKVPHIGEAESLYERALAVQGAHWPSAALRRAKLLLAQRRDPESIERALELLRRAAALQNREAAFVLGGLMEEGAGGRQDLDGARNLYRLALRSGHGPAGLALARLETDPAKANVYAMQGVKLLFEEARQGSADAARLLADHYRATGEGPERLRTAIEWYRRAVDLGDDEAALHLGRLYLDPKSAMQRPKEARDFFLLAAQRGSIEAAMILAEDPYKGAILGVPGSEAELWLNRAIETGSPHALVLAAEIRSQGGEEGQKAAKALLAEAIRRVDNDVAALVAIGRHARDGVLMERDVPLALKLFDRAAGADSVAASYEFARTALIYPEEVTDDMRKAALERLRSAADRGHAKAAVMMGDAYLRGRSLSETHEEALRWYRKAAENGSAVAYIRIGDFYAGRATATEALRALEWYRKAADAESAIAMVRLGKMFGEGRGVPQDQALAAAWFSRAAAMGSGAAMVELGALYAHVGGPDHVNMARESLEKASRSGDLRAPIALAKLYLVRGERQPAENTLKKSAEGGSAEAALQLADLLASGQPTPEQANAARRWLAFAERTTVNDDGRLGRLALVYLKLPDAASIGHGLAILEALVRKNDAEAMTLLATALLKGAGMKPDPARAEALLRRAVQLGDDGARFVLAKAYRDGVGLPRDPARAFALYRELYNEEPGDTRVQLALGDSYARGDGVPQDRRVAAEFYSRAAQQGDPEGQLRLGTAYLHGGGMPRDERKAEQWLSRAAESGLVAAKIQLASAKLSGLGTAIDAEGAFVSHLRAAEAGSPVAMIEVARALIVGLGTQADPLLARTWLERAAALGSSDAMFELYRLNEIGGSANAHEAERWLKQAAQSGHAAAMYRLSLHYRQGTSGQDDAAAREWLAKAAQAGHAQAVKALARQASAAPQPE